MKKYYYLIITSICLLSTNNLRSQAINEGFNDITTLVPNGWYMQNNSNPLGTSNWFQGNTTVFNAQSGPVDSYIGANFNNCAGTGTISNWLVTPERTIKNGDVITFYTRKTDDPTDYPDRLEVRMSTNGPSINVGATANDVGDFTDVLLSINPALVVGGYPLVWQQYTITISGLTAPTQGKFAFRYFVNNGGPTGTNSDYIGIDNFVYTPYVCPTLTISPSSLPDATAGVAYNQSLSQTGALGSFTYTVTSGSLPPGISMSANGDFTGTPTATGSNSFDVTLTDASGCTTTETITIDVVCATNTAQLNTIPDLCTNEGLYTLTEGQPAGGTYTGTGVTGNDFDPSVGSQTITYEYTDTYGCLTSDDQLVVVYQAPNVSLTVQPSDACDDQAAVSLSGGNPTGGMYSGTFVSGNSFDPTAAGAGNHEVTYTFTDGNGCSGTATDTILVDACASTENLDLISNMQIFPNPSKGKVQVSFTLDQQEEVQFTVRDIQGKVYFKSTVEKMNGSVQKEIDLSDLSAGIYSIVINISGDKSVQKLIIE